MPTGYTANIEKGITFEQFIMDCARAFGSLISMRDAPSDAKIPEKFKPSSYHKDRLKEIEKELLIVRKMNTKVAFGRAKQDYEEELKHKEDGIRKAEALRESYLFMLAKVRAWQPPSIDHIGLKKFMNEQITKSIDWDCGTDYYIGKRPVRLSGQQWKEKRLANLMKDYTYNKKEYSEEVERIEGRNTWIRLLRESL
jgi:hypothetical protein